MSPSPAERFSALLARSGERGWSPDDDVGDDDVYDDDDAEWEETGGDHAASGDSPAAGVRTGFSRVLLLCLLGAVLTAVLVLVLAPSLLKGETPVSVRADDGGWEAAQAEEPAEGPEPAAGAGGGRGASPAAVDDDGPASTGTVSVHVVGAVSRPGVIDLPASSRVEDAVDAAGGALAEADIDSLNLARVLVDGEQIRVPRVGDDPAAVAAQGGGPAGGPAGDAVGGASGGGLIDLNTADAQQLETLPGVGPVTAQSIIDHRETVGGFASVDDLLDVTGIGDATLSRIRDSVTVT